MERRPGVLATSVFEERNIHFSDDLPLLRKVAQLNTIVCIVLSNTQMKKMGDKALKGTSLKMESLHKHILGTDIEGTLVLQRFHIIH